MTTPLIRVTAANWPRDTERILAIAHRGLVLGERAANCQLVLRHATEIKHCHVAANVIGHLPPPPSPGHLLPPREINHRRHLYPGWGGWGLESYGRCLGVWVRLLRTELVLRLVHST